MRSGKLYTVLFAAGVCGVFSVVVALSAVLLKDRQDENLKLDRIKNLLTAAGIVESGKGLSGSRALELFEKNIEVRVVDFETDSYSDAADPATYDQKAATADPAASRKAPPNNAGLVRVPKLGLVYLIRKAGSDQGWDGVIVPVEGKGLWSTLYGYLALESDLETVRGITFYQHGETPGLGGEIENPRWRAGWKGRRIYDAAGNVVFRVAKGPAGNDQSAVDGISGATLTSRGVTNLVGYWLGDQGYKKFLASLKSNGMR